MSDLDSRARRLNVSSDGFADTIERLNKGNNKEIHDKEPKMCPKCKKLKTEFIGAVCKECKNEYKTNEWF